MRSADRRPARARSLTVDQCHATRTSLPAVVRTVIKHDPFRWGRFRRLASQHVRHPGLRWTRPAEVSYRRDDAPRAGRRRGRPRAGATRRAMPSFFIMRYKVDRFIPRRAAVPFGPPSTQWVWRSTARMCSRSASARLPKFARRAVGSCGTSTGRTPGRWVRAAHKTPPHRLRVGATPGRTAELAWSLVVPGRCLGGHVPGSCSAAMMHRGLNELLGLALGEAGDLDNQAL